MGEIFQGWVTDNSALEALKVVAKAATHATVQGTIATMDGGDFGSSFLTGFAGSMVGSAGDALKWGSVGTVSSAMLMGGVSSELSGGDFWRGAAIGGIVAGANDVAHRVGASAEARIQQKRAAQSGTQQSGNLYEEGTHNFNYFQKAYLPVEGIGVAGSFRVKGSYRIARNSDGTWSVYVGASGSTPASLAGDVTFSGNANLIVNGEAMKGHSFVVPNSLIYETGMTPVGLISFTLPASGTVQLQLNISYQFKGPEGVAVPMPGLNRVLNIPLYNPGYLSPK